MKRPLRIAFCLIWPLYPDNVLFLVKQKRKKLGGLALRWYLRFFHGIDHSQLYAGSEKASKADLPTPIIQAIGCVGFIRLCSELKGTVREDTDIDYAISGDKKYPPDRAVSDSKLESLLKGKSVAVVGPAQGEDNEAEIAAFDWVVRVGYSGKASLPEGTGDRCDLSFYAPHKMRKMVKGNKHDVLNELTLVVVFKTDRYFNHGMKLEDIPVDRKRLVEVPLPLFNLTKPNTLVKVLYNCLMANPSRIKVFNADLFLSANYPSGYIGNKGIVTTGSGWSQEAKGLCRSFAVNHDPAEQIEFYKFFYGTGLFEADAVLSRVIGMNSVEYLDQLETRYGTPVRMELGLS